jgi:predicted transcriptional regulator
MPPKKPPLGDQELALLRFVAEHGPLSVGEAAERYGVPQGLARSTVLTVMERLRKKRYLRRRSELGVYRYESVSAPDELLRGVVGSFVDTALAGAVSPFVAYLAESGDLTEDEQAQLQALAARLDAKRKGSGHA